MDGGKEGSPKALEYLTKYLEIRDYSKALVLANAILTNYPNNELVSEIRKYILLQLDAPDDFEPITEQELEEVENFDPNEEIFSDSDEDEEEEEEDDSDEEEEEVVKKIAPPPPKPQPTPKPKVGKLPPPKQRKPVKKIVKPNVRVAVHNVHNVPVSKKK